MNKILILVVCLFLSSNYKVFGQNILSNYSFEQFTSPAWYPILSVDILNAGMTQEGYVVPAHGAACAGLRFFSPIADDWQEYICQGVLGQLDSGTTYRVSFKYKLSDRCIYSTDDLGVGFLHGPYGYQNLSQSLIQTMQVDLKGPENVPLTNYTSWQEFSHYYTANGTESFIVIGSFKRDSDLSFIPIANPTNNPMPDIYFFIDEVKLEACPPMPESLLEERKLICDSMPGLIYTETMADSYLWSNGTTNDSILVLNSENLIWLDATFGSCKMRDSMQVERFSVNTDLGPDILVCDERNLPTLLETTAEMHENVVWGDGTQETFLVVNEPGIYSVKKYREHCIWHDTLEVIDLSEEMRIYPNPTIQEVYFKHPENILIHAVYMEDGKILKDEPMTVTELNSFIQHVQSAVYLLELELFGCRKIVPLTILKE